MKHSLQMYIQYEIKESSIEHYEQLIQSILHTLPYYDAFNIQWQSVPEKPNQFTEVFTLPTESHYHALKKLRKSRQHLLFGMLDGCISGGLKQMDCFALKSVR
ncbi:hypothetical protein [Bacillus sp. AK031]